MSEHARNFTAEKRAATRRITALELELDNVREDLQLIESDEKNAAEQRHPKSESEFS